jgi:hypothetical protein
MCSELKLARLRVHRSHIAKPTTLHLFVLCNAHEVTLHMPTFLIHGAFCVFVEVREFASATINLSGFVAREIHKGALLGRRQLASTGLAVRTRLQIEHTCPQR